MTSKDEQFTKKFIITQLNKQGLISYSSTGKPYLFYLSSLSESAHEHAINIYKSYLWTCEQWDNY
jgi:hypothetical protein